MEMLFNISTMVTGLAISLQSSPEAIFLLKSANSTGKFL